MSDANIKRDTVIFQHWSVGQCWKIIRPISGLGFRVLTKQWLTMSFAYAYSSVIVASSSYPLRKADQSPSCPHWTSPQSGAIKTRVFSNKPSGLSAGRLPIADARHRFAAGSARRIAKRKQGKNIWGPLPGLCSRAERRFIFYPSSLTSSPHNSRWC